MNRWIKRRNPFAFLFVKSKGEDYLAQYVLREHGRGRSLAEVMNDPYVRNRSTADARARLLERADVVAAIGQTAVADLKRAVDDARVDRRGPAVRLRPQSSTTKEAT